MPNLIDIRRRIKSVKNTQQITKAMKMVAASRLRRTSERALDARLYSERIAQVHDSIVSRVDEIKGPLYREKEGRILVVPISSDKGLCGSFNTNLLRGAKNWIQKQGPDDVAVFAIGKKAVNYFKKQAIDTVGTLKEFYRDVDVAVAERVAKELSELYLQGDYRQVILVFNKFKNVLVQEVTFNSVLPLSKTDESAESTEFAGVEHLAEPSLQAILDEMGPAVLLTQVYQALLESSAAELAARMTAMDGATKNAGEMIEKLTLDMNKARQAAITKELIEIVSGAAAM